MLQQKLRRPQSAPSSKVIRAAFRSLSTSNSRLAATSMW
jgi:hypothetical protein